MKEIRIYKTENGKSPFESWINKLDNVVKARVIKRLERVSEGNYGDCKKIDTNLSELRFTFGPGYRIYFTEMADVIVVLLCGGDKSTQVQDIKKAHIYLQDLMERNK